MPRGKARSNRFSALSSCDGIPPVPPPGLEAGCRGVGLGLYCIQHQEVVCLESRVMSKNKELQVLLRGKSLAPMP